MRKSFNFLWLVLLCLCLSACKKQQKSDIILVDQPAPVQPRQTERVGDFEQTYDVQWNNHTYRVFVSRQADESLPLAKEGDQSYYDNRLQLRISSLDGTVLYENTFQKSDFNAFLPDAFKKNSVLLGLAYDRSDSQYLYFLTSVGSPDPSSEEYVPITLRIDRNGQMTLNRAQRIDSTLTNEDEEP